MIKYGFTPHNPNFNKLDVLQAYIDECHKRKIKVNVWFESFYAGNRNPLTNKTGIVAVCPTWANTTKKSYNSKNPVSSASEHNGYFLDPANPEVHTFLCELLCEIITKYKPDGINLDYVRYPHSHAPKTASGDGLCWGYTQYAREEFKSLYCVDPVEITPCDECWATWCKYRQDCVTKFVKKASQICRSNNTTVTAVIFPNRTTAMANKQQDWATWSACNYVDGFTPLFLTCDPKTASNLMQGVIKYKNPKTKLYAGIFVTFMNGSRSDLIRQVHELRKLNLNGFSIFDYAHCPDEYLTTLKQSICTPPPKPRRIYNNKKNRRTRGRR